jgi:type IV secretion system protein VirD4
MSERGTYLGRTKENKALRYDKDAHILTVAQSGGGKNTSLIMPNLLMDRFDGAKIVLDLKGENSAVCSHWKEKEKKGKVFRLNPWHIFDMPTTSYNPFCTFDSYDDDLYDDCIAFADVIIPTKTNQSDTGEHFDDLARDFIASFLLYLTIKNYPEKPTPVLLYDELIRSTSSVEKLKYTADDMLDIPHPDKDIKRILELSAITFKGLISTGDNNELRGVKTTLARSLKSFKGKRLSNIVKSETDESLGLLDALFHEDGNNDLYISFPQSEIRQSEIWLRLVLASFIRNIIKEPPCKPVLFILDEFPQLGTFNLIKDNVAFLRGYGVRFWFICQSLSQLEDSYGKNGKLNIIENCSVSLFFNVKDDTAKYVSEKLDSFSKDIESYDTHEYRSQYKRERKTRLEVEQEQDTITFIEHQVLMLRRIPYYQIDSTKDKAAPNPLIHGIEAYKAYVSEIEK